MKLIYKTWRDISVNKFLEIEDILTDKDISDDDKNLSLVSLFCDMTEDDILKLKSFEYDEALGELNEFFSQPLPNINKISFNEININGISYKVIKDMKDFTVAQYLDFQAYVKDNTDKSMCKILSTFLIPKHKIYNDGYDIVETIEIFGDNIDIITARGLFNFFQKRLENCTHRSLTSFKWMMRMMIMIPKKIRSQIIMNINQIIGYI